MVNKKIISTEVALNEFPSCLMNLNYSDLLASFYCSPMDGQSQTSLEEWKQVVGVSLGLYSKNSVEEFNVLGKQIDYFKAKNLSQGVKRSVFTTRTFTGDLPLSINNLMAELNQFSKDNLVLTEEDRTITQGYHLLRARNGVLTQLSIPSSLTYEAARKDLSLFRILKTW